MDNKNSPSTSDMEEGEIMENSGIDKTNLLLQIVNINLFIFLFIFSIIHMLEFKSLFIQSTSSFTLPSF
jgi:hypothetical protein